MTRQTSNDRIALIADIHGNTWALDAVLADIERRGIGRIVNLGDSVYGSLDPRGTAERLIEAGIPSICGNQDRDVFAPSERGRASDDYRFVLGELSAAHVEWLRGQPATMIADEIFCCHGTPLSDETYLLERVTAHGVFLRDGKAILEQLGGVEQPVIACAHSHVPRLAALPTGQLVVNPGSVGIPAYEEDTHYPHVMEAGSPHARYAIVTRHGEEWDVAHIAVAYAWVLAAAAARSHGRPDRAEWIATGRARLPAS
jgi:diadenosine tetraphosphatase ApaH/serine/threonine PP2A family protein phosphatase